jgi:hypothetical protein
VAFSNRLLSAAMSLSEFAMYGTRSNARVSIVNEVYS